MVKYYRGQRFEHGCEVSVDHQPLRMRLDLRNHSPCGFEWGYGGSGPAQLALAILADCLGDDVALECYQSFKRTCVAHMRSKQWVLSEDDVREWYSDWRKPNG